MSRSFSIVESMSRDRDEASSAAIAATTSCAARGSSTLGRAGYGFSAGPLSARACTTTPARIPTTKSDSVVTALTSFTAHHLAAGYGQCQRKELIDPLGVAKVDSVDMHRVRAHGRAAHVRKRQRLDLRWGSTGDGALQLVGPSRDALVV